MRTVPPNLFQFLGLSTNGDVADWTVYTSQRGELVVFLKTWPKDPATYNQTLNRNHWRHAAIRWRSLPKAIRRRWFQIGKAAHCNVTGYNLFMYYMLDKNIATIRTLERQTGLSIIAETGSPLPHRPA